MGSEMERDTLEPKRYRYLSKEDSDLYDRAVKGEIEVAEARTVIMRLLERLRDVSRAAHRACPY